MARNTIFVAARPQEVFDVLADPRTYALWVVGSREVRAGDRSWPQPGSAFDHSVGRPPLIIKDDTEVLASRPPVMIELRARARPLPSAHITIHLHPEGNGTRVTMIEDPANPLLRLAGGPLMHAALRLRNREALKRLKALAEGRTGQPRKRLPARAQHAG